MVNSKVKLRFKQITSSAYYYDAGEEGRTNLWGLDHEGLVWRYSCGEWYPLNDEGYVDNGGE